MGTQMPGKNAAAPNGRRMANRQRPSASRTTAIPPSNMIKRQAFSGQKYSGIDFRNQHFVDLNAHKAEFSSCDFSYSIFERGYFRGSKFEGCNFTGARFYDSHLIGATYNQCDLSYAKFHRTLLEPLEIIATLPSQPNLRRDVLQNLRINSVETGDYDAQRSFVLEEILAKEDHYSRAFRGTDNYYRQKYNTVIDRALSGLQWLSLRFSGFLWGHGERPFKILASASLFLLGLTLLNFWHVLGHMYFKDTGWGIQILRYCFEVFLDISPNKKFHGFLFVNYLLVIMRYIYIGLFISVLFKRVCHR